MIYLLYIMIIVASLFHNIMMPTVSRFRSYVDTSDWLLVSANIGTTILANWNISVLYKRVLKLRTGTDHGPLAPLYIQCLYKTCNLCKYCTNL